jgi:hypothetical protein
MEATIKLSRPARQGLQLRDNMLCDLAFRVIVNAVKATNMNNARMRSVAVGIRAEIREVRHCLVQQVIMQIWVSSHFGVISKWHPAADESIGFIGAHFYAAPIGCKVRFPWVFWSSCKCHASQSLPCVRNISLSFNSVD